jgi:hypothetical protein
MQWEGSYEELMQYLRGFKNMLHDPVPYDTNGVLHLMLAVLDNLRDNASEEDLTQLAADVLTEEQATFLQALAEWQALPEQAA